MGTSRSGNKARKERAQERHPRPGVSALFCALALAALSCSRESAVAPGPATPGGLVKVRVAASAHSMFPLLARRAYLTVSAPDMATTVAELTVNDSSVAGEVAGVPAGRGRLFAVTVYDSLDILRYRGEVSGDLAEGDTLALPITVSRTNGMITSAGDTLPRAGLLAHYAFSGNLADLSGNGHDGTSHGAVLDADRLGRPACAYRFGGADYVSIPYDSALDFTTQPFTVVAWICIELPGFDHRRLIDHYAVGGSGYVVLVNDADVMYDGKRPTVIPTRFVVNSWHMVAAIHTADSLKVVVDDSLAGAAASAPNSPYAGGLRIGAAQNGAGGFVGRIDDVRIYGRALTGRELKALLWEHR